MLFISYLSSIFYYLCVGIYFIYSSGFNQVILYYVCLSLVLWFYDVYSIVFVHMHACRRLALQERASFVLLALADFK